MKIKRRAMGPKEFEKRMKIIQDCKDAERAHGESDDLMCPVLRDLGYKNGVEIFEESERWSA